ncbi:MAG: hypothetical protein JRI91_08535 [Deltaproteobacteria bacterium]|nr:hypothetical protein [Deltaproteobacteria bacterium]
MRTKSIFFLIIITAVMIPGQVFSDSMDNLSDEFSKSYESLKPAPNSSVGADYKLDQVALGALYTNKSLNLIYKQNQEMADKYNILIKKYDRIINQNKEIIRLLSIIAKQENIDSY